MSSLLVILVITFIFIVGGGLAFFRIFRRKQAAYQPKLDESAAPAEKHVKTGFRLSFVALPIVILIIAAGIIIYFYGKLPNEVAYSFGSDDLPTAWLSRSEIILWAFIPQLLLALLAVVITYGASNISSLFKQGEDTGIKLDAILLVMSNMVVIPQLILVFAVLNIFSYNAFQTHISFIWAFVLTVAVLGIVLLSIFFVHAIRKIRGVSQKPPEIT
ncbi:MAG: hypothetical protein PHY28_06850 [Dehalococcoidales bacterium]|nr:hypothetical protein [Dehalococcoidales bacterium]